MKRVAGWVILIFGILLAIYPLGFLLGWLGRRMLGEADPPLDVSAMVGSVVIGGALIWAGWALLQSMRESGDGSTSEKESLE